MEFQNTILHPMSFAGVGLHTGKPVSLALTPAKSDTGIIINEIPALWDRVVSTNYSTCLGDKHTTIHMVEHLMAALYANRIDNVICTVKGEAIPVLDGSASHFSTAFTDSRKLTKPRKSLIIKKEVSIKEGLKYIKITPADALYITATIYFPEVGNQTYSTKLNKITFNEDISRARTFGFAKDLDVMKRNSLIKGASLDNAILISNKGEPSTPFRVENELVKHKILDLIGDIALSGSQIKGHIKTYCPGHSMNVALIKKIFSDPNNYEIGV